MNASEQAVDAVERPVATGELIDIRDLADYLRKHGLRRVRNEWPPASRYPLAVVEDDPERSKEPK